LKNNPIFDTKWLSFRELFDITIPFTTLVENDNNVNGNSNSNSNSNSNAGIPTRIARIFFNLNIESFSMKTSQILNMELVTKFVIKFWNSVVVPSALKNRSDTLTVQMKFRTSDGQWRNAGKYTSWNITQMHRFLEYLNFFFNRLANHYEAAGLEIDQIDFSWKFLGTEDAFIKKRTSVWNESVVRVSNNFNRIANAIPLTLDYKNIPATTIIKSKFENRFFIQGITLKNVLGMDQLLTNWDIEQFNTHDNIGFNVAIHDNEGNLITKFTDIPKFLDNDNLLVIRTFNDGTKLEFNSNNLIKITAKKDPNQVFMDKQKLWNWEEISKELMFFLRFAVAKRSFFKQKMFFCALQ